MGKPIVLPIKQRSSTTLLIRINNKKLRDSGWLNNNDSLRLIGSQLLPNYRNSEFHQKEFRQIFRQIRNPATCVKELGLRPASTCTFPVLSLTNCKCMWLRSPMEADGSIHLSRLTKSTGRQTSWGHITPEASWWGAWFMIGLLFVQPQGPPKSPKPSTYTGYPPPKGPCSGALSDSTYALSHLFRQQFTKPIVTNNSVTPSREWKGEQ